MKQVTRKSTQAFSASLSLGLQRGYSDKLFDKEDIIKWIQQYQEQLIRNSGIYLSVAVSDSFIVLREQREPHLVISFINYPKFLIEENRLRKEIEQLALALMSEFDQNRMVIEYADETVMFEYTDGVDTRVLM